MVRKSDMVKSSKSEERIFHILTKFFQRCKKLCLMLTVLPQNHSVTFDGLRWILAHEGHLECWMEGI